VENILEAAALLGLGWTDFQKNFVAEQIHCPGSSMEPV
jgi:hypothetical protein